MPGSVEALVVELHNIVKCGCNAIMKIGCSSGQSAQNRPFDLADVGALAGDHGPARIGNLVRGAIRALNGVDGQT